jgi:hypothetical protein
MLLCLLLWSRFRKGLFENSIVHKLFKTFGSITVTHISNRFIFTHTTCLSFHFLYEQTVQKEVFPSLSFCSHLFSKQCYRASYMRWIKDSPVCSQPASPLVASSSRVTRAVSDNVAATFVLCD